jgi:hypothetical protein
MFFNPVLLVYSLQTFCFVFSLSFFPFLMRVTSRTFLQMSVEPILDESSFDETNVSLLSTTLLSATSPLSPASNKIIMRNVIHEYIDEVVALLEHLYEFKDPGLPYIYPQAVRDTLDGVIAWMNEEDQPEIALRLALERLEEEMASCGVALYLELQTKEARKNYRIALENFTEWLHQKQHKTGADQPLTDAERFVMTDFVEVERRWASRADTALAPRREFAERIRTIQQLRNDEAESKLQDDMLAALSLNDGLAARRRRLYEHVGRRAAMLRSTPKDNLSLKQRRDCKTIASAVMLWIDEHRDDPATIDELADQLQRVCETSQETSAAADIVARRNEVMEMLDFLRSSLMCPPICEALGADRAEALSFIVGKSEGWLEDHPNPTIQTLEKFVESLRLAASKYGLSPPTVDAPVPLPPGSELTTETAVTSAGVGGPTPHQTAATIRNASAVYAEQVLVMNIACVLLEELQVLRVACAAGDASAFIARRIAPIQLEVEDVLHDPMAMKDGAAPLLRRYKVLLQSVRVEAAKVQVPPSCWAHVLPFETVELED